ncbi:ubiquitin-conjugating enzyme E2 D4 isoform X3 [Tursiops truncatus]|uniref:ubiquitin-conjugating enzyme E2 D4 isoform X3 n=1 Tax=Tursiops truncatus TaxID=9739 RepID=UPI003CCF9A6E
MALRRTQKPRVDPCFQGYCRSLVFLRRANTLLRNEPTCRGILLPSALQDLWEMMVQQTSESGHRNMLCRREDTETSSRLREDPRVPRTRHRVSLPTRDENTRTPMSNGLAAHS